MSRASFAGYYFLVDTHPVIVYNARRDKRHHHIMPGISAQMKVPEVSVSYRHLSFMTFALAAQFHVYLPWVNAHLAQCLNRRALLRDCTISHNIRKGSFEAQLYCFTLMALHPSCSCKGLHFCESWWSGKCCQQMPGWGLSFDLCCAIKSNFHSAHHQDYWELVFLLAAARIILTKPCITQPAQAAHCTRYDFLTRAIYYLWRWFPVTLFQLNELNNNNFNERPRILASSAVSPLRVTRDSLATLNTMHGCNHQ